MKAKIVKFNNGKYAVRIGSICKRYASIKDIVSCKPLDSVFFWFQPKYANEYTVDSLEYLDNILETYSKRKPDDLKEVAVIREIRL